MNVDLTRAEIGDTLAALVEYRRYLEDFDMAPATHPHMFEHLDAAIDKLGAAYQAEHSMTVEFGDRIVCVVSETPELIGRHGVITATGERGVVAKLDADTRPAVVALFWYSEIEPEP